MEGGLCSNDKPVRVGLREQGCVAGAVCFTCNEGNAIKIANMGRHASDISQGSDGSSADSQTALRGRTDFLDLTIMDTESEGMCC